jgi:hypothetical protein
MWVIFFHHPYKYRTITNYNYLLKFSNLTHAFNIIDFGSTRASTPLSVYIQNSLNQALNDALIL